MSLACTKQTDDCKRKMFLGIWQLVLPRSGQIYCKRDFVIWLKQEVM